MDNKKDIYSQISSILVTKAATVNIINRLETLRDLSFTKDISKFQQEYLDLNILTGRVLEEEFGAAPTPSVLSEFIPACIKYLKEAENVDVTLAFDPSPEFLHKVYAWFQNFFKFAFLLSITVDSSICGGIQLSYKGQYVDLSLRRKIADYLSENREDVFSKL